MKGEKKMNRYAELRNRQQAEFNALPLGFAFSNEQFNRMMKGWGLDPEKDCDKIYRIPGGGFVQKKDHAHLHEVMNRHDKELQEAIAADTTGDGFVYDMFLYELRNHEFGYTGEIEDTLDALGYTSEEIEADARLKHGLSRAITKIYEEEM